ncbi:MutS domain-containing III family protein [Cryptosporidium serpentis]
MADISELDSNLCFLCSIALRVSLSGPVAGLSFFNNKSGTFSVCEVSDNDQFSEIESLLVRNKPNMLVYSIQNDQLGLKRFKNIVEMQNSTAEEIRSKACTMDSIIDALSPLLRRSHRSYKKELESDIIRESLYNLINHFRLNQSSENDGKCEIKFLLVDGYMRMDSACIHSLKIFPVKGESPRASTSLYGLLNKTRTAIGSRKLESWLRQPLTDLEIISKRQDLVEFFSENDILRQKIYGAYLRKVCDLDKISSKFRRVASINFEDIKSLKQSYRNSESLLLKCTLEDVVKVYDSISQSTLMFKDITKSISEMGTLETFSKKIIDSIYSLILFPLEEILSRFKGYIQLVECTVDLDEANNGNYFVVSYFTPELEALAKEKERIKKNIESHRKEIEDFLYEERGQMNFDSNREAVRVLNEGADNLLCFRVTRKDIEFFQDKRFKKVRINKNDYIFRTQELCKLSEEQNEAISRYNKAQTLVLTKTISVASTYWSLIEKLSNILGTIDVLLSFTLTSLCAPKRFVRPKITDGSCNNKEEPHKCGCRLICKNLRHPLVEAQGNLGTAFVANNVDMHRHGNLLTVITGPNMGGKSTYIRQIAICTLLGQIGCFVPAEEAQLPIMHQLMCRIGASDAQLLGISTFFAEMIEAAAILRSATPQTLVIVDELGRGTSTYDGFGLAWSIASCLVKEKQSYTLFATHFHELSILEFAMENVTNLKVTAATKKRALEKNENILTFFYKVEKGSADESLGVDVAELSGLPEVTIKRARQKASELEDIERIYMDTSATREKRVRTLIDISSKLDLGLRKILDSFIISNTPMEFKENVSGLWENLRDLSKGNAEICSA